MLPLLPPAVASRAEARDTIAARRALDVLNAPRPGTEAARDPDEARPSRPPSSERRYREAGRRSGVSPTLLAAVNLIESDFGRVRNESVAGAQGPMQFMPATWKSLRPRRRHAGPPGRDPRGRPLPRRRRCRPQSESGALYRYNPSPLYVTAVSRYARVMRRDPLAFHALYAAGAAEPAG